MDAQNVTLIGNDLKFAKALDFARSISVTKAPALIVGEVGTGKRTICSYIHNLSARKDKELIIVDCSQDIKTVENEILGFRDEESGRFQKGALESGNGGTVVFANVDGLEEGFQKRLFKILQELPDYDIDIRLLATTSKNLSKYVGAGRFYRALYTFFSNTQIVLNPLRERVGDIELIANHILEGIAEENEKELSIAPEVMEKFNSHYWAHNIAELKAILEKAAEEAEDEITATHLEFGERKAEIRTLSDDDDGIRLMSLREAEKLLIRKALLHTCENRTQAAKILGVSIRTLRNKINEYRNDGSAFFVNLR